MNKPRITKAANGMWAASWMIRYQSPWKSIHEVQFVSKHYTPALAYSMLIDLMGRSKLPWRD